MCTGDTKPSYPDTKQRGRAAVLASRRAVTGQRKSEPPSREPEPRAYLLPTPAPVCGSRWPQHTDATARHLGSGTSEGGALG